MILLHHKGAVDGEGEGGDGGEDGEIEGEQEGGEDLTIGRILLAPTLLKIYSNAVINNLSKGIKRIQGPTPEESVPKHPEQHSGKKLAEDALHSSKL